MSDLTAELFQRIHVCRAFRLSGLHHILQRFSTIPPIDKNKLPWKLGDLVQAKYIYNEKGYYVVDPERVKDFSPKSPDFSACSLHDAWRDWYQLEFGKHHQHQELAELLYHEAAYSKCTAASELIAILQKNVEKYLWEYCRSFESLFTPTFTLPFPHLKNAFEQLTIYLQDNGYEELSNDVSSYLEHLIDWLTKLNRWDEMVSSSEYDTFITFLNSLNYLNHEE